MPPPLALLLCTAFVLFLVRVERRDSAGVSAAAWIPTLWMLATVSKPLAIWFGIPGDNESGSGLDRLILTILAGAAIVVLARRRFDWVGALRPHGWLLLLLAYMCISTLWSDITSIALKRWLRELIVVVMALVIRSETNPRLALESLLRRSAYILIPFSVVLIKYYPSLGVNYAHWSGKQMWIGVTLQKNTLGRLCCIATFFLAWALYRRWRESAGAAGRRQAWPDAFVLLIALFLLKGAGNAYSATSLGALAVGAASSLALLWLRKLKSPVPLPGLLALMIFLIGFGASAPFLGGSNVASFSSTLGRDETLTGRTDTWAELVPVVQRQPILGCGFASFWTTARREYYNMSHAHNGYLDILLELGGVGLVIYALWLLSCARKFHGVLAGEYDWASFAISLLLMAAVYNATESAFNTLSVDLTAVVALASLVVPNELVSAPRRSHLSLRLHVPPERVVGTAAAQPGRAKNGWAVQLLNRGGGQRRRWSRPGNRGPVSGRGAP
jgi:exopolysaccharide production protein ExoQ